VCFSIAGIPASIAAVYLPFGVCKERSPSQVIIKVELIQIHAAHVGDAHEHELVGEMGNLLVETNNLLVESFAVRSPLASEDQKDWLVRFAPRRDTFLIIGNPTGRSRLVLLTVGRESRGSNCQKNARS
jgi:hypothetical protein